MALAVSLASVPSARGAETLVGAEEVSRTLAIDSLSVQGDRVAGVIMNLSDRTVRDVQLRVVYSWLWADEHRQGTDDPSFALTEVIPDSIAPRAQTTFGYSYPMANTMRSDGRFLVEVRVIGFRVASESRGYP